MSRVVLCRLAQIQEVLTATKEPYDRSGKWLLQHHGGAILKIGGTTGIRTCRAAQAEVVQARQIPDGLLEVEFAPRPGNGSEQATGLYIVEVATYPQPRVSDQMTRDVACVFLDRGRLPDAITLVLRPHPRSPHQVTGEHAIKSDDGWTELKLAWRVIELWNVPAEQLLAAGDVGMIPWVPLSRIDGPPEAVLRECRARIDAQARPDERENLLAVTQVLAGLRYNDPGIMELFGGRKTMIESPVIQELVSEVEHKAKHEDILLILESRFGSVPADVAASVTRVVDETSLRSLIQQAARCADIDGFRRSLPAGV